MRCRYCYGGEVVPIELFYACKRCGRALVKCFNGKLIESGKRVFPVLGQDNEWARKHRAPEVEDERSDTTQRSGPTHQGDAPHLPQQDGTQR
jgi:hypothetical protein